MNSAALEKKNDVRAVIVLLVTVFAVYAACLPNTFIFDDYHMIVKNNFLKHADSFPEFFKGTVTSYPIARGMYRPLLMLTFSLDYALGGLKPYGYHFVNILIHFLNACFLYALFKKFFKGLDTRVMLGLALLFCVHPLNTESVVYVSSRSIILCSLFIFSGFYAYLLWRESGKNRYYLFSAFSYAAALLTKETGLVFPLIIAAYEFAFAKDLSFERIIRIVKRLSIFIGVTFLYLVLIKFTFGDVFGLFGAAKEFAAPRSFSSNILTQSAVSFFYLFLFLFPFNLCVDHAFPVISDFSVPAGAISAVLIAVILGCALLIRRRLPVVSFALVWYFICLLPQFYARLNLVSAEHHSYAAFFGVYFLIAFLCAALIKKTFSLGEAAVTVTRKAGRLIFTFVFILFFILTVLRCMEWRTEYTLWKATLRVNPRSGIAQGGLALNLIGRGYIAEGLRYLKESLDSPSHSATRVVSLLNFAYYQALLGDPAQAARILDENKELLIKKYPFGYFKNLAVVYGKLGRTAEELKALETARLLMPESEEINGMLGWWYLQNGSDAGKAEEYFRVSIRDNPDYSFSRLGLAGALEKKGGYAEALAEYEKVIRISPDSSEAYYNIGRIYARKSSGSEAEWYFKKCIELAPGFAPAYHDLCIFYLSRQNPDPVRARKYCDKARELGYTGEEKMPQNPEH